MFVLRWFFWDDAAEYYTGKPGMAHKQSEAKRFATRAEAYAAVGHTLYYGAGGKDDRAGWKVVRLVRKKK